MRHVICLLRQPTSSNHDGFATELAALSGLCFAGYLGLLVF